MGRVNASLLKHKLIIGVDDRGKLSCHKVTTTTSITTKCNSNDSTITTTYNTNNNKTPNSNIHTHILIMHT